VLASRYEAARTKPLSSGAKRRKAGSASRTSSIFPKPMLIHAQPESY